MTMPDTQDAGAGLDPGTDGFEGVPGGTALAVRPEKIVLGVPAAGLSGRIESANFLGGHTLYRILTADGRQLLAKETNIGDRPIRESANRGVDAGLGRDRADARVRQAPCLPERVRARCSCDDGSWSSDDGS